LPAKPLNSLVAWFLAGAAFTLAGSLLSVAQQVNVVVDAARTEGPMPTAWTYFGYDEPNFTYSVNGRKLLSELRVLSPAPVYLRTHNLLTSGDGNGSLKWGSTNAYTEDAQGRPVYDWTILDRIFDAYRDAGVRPLVEIGFMPEALTTGPPPYRHSFPKGSVFTGWSYPPRDYAKWGELVFQMARHLRERYGDAAVKTWLWEVWNEPDIDYWHGTAAEYFHLYDVSAAAVRRAMPFAQVGGPETTGAGNDHAAEYLRSFLEHCAHGKNAVTGAKGAPLDFISFHPKGSPQWVEGHVRMGIAAQLRSIDRGFQVVASFPEWRHTPVILGESDPEGCGACTAKDHPQNGYRNGPIYATYEVLSLKSTLALAEKHGVNFRGAVTWAFQFDDQPYFEGLRELATNGIDKPVLNGFRMMGLLQGTRVAATSDAAVSAEEIAQTGVRNTPDVDAMATAKGREIDALILNYHEDEVAAEDAKVHLKVEHLPVEAGRRVLVEHFRIDDTHSNSYAAWRRMGEPQQPTSEQYKELERTGQLQMDGSPEWVPVESESVDLSFDQPREGLSLLRISW
jgi:xylan 1,4-beta-xylosidase